MTYSRSTCNQDYMASRTDYVELGLACADACEWIPDGADEQSPSMIEAIEQLSRCVELAMDMPGGLLTQLAITGFWRRFRIASLSGVNRMRSGDSSIQGTTRRRLPPGGWSSTRSFTSSRCVPSPLYSHLVPIADHPPPDRTYMKQRNTR